MRLFILTLTLLSALVAADFATLFDFNNGVAEDGKSCSATEWATIQAAMEAAVPKATRRLGASLQLHRSLNSCAYCGPYCVKVGNGCVRSGRRRALASTELVSMRSNELVEMQSSHHTRHLGHCDKDMAAVTTALDALLPTLVGSCHALVAAPRNVTCVPTTHDCFVQSFTLWDARSDTIIQDRLNATGTTFCRRQLISFGATTNYFIGKMNFVIRGISPGSQYFTNRTEWSAPYFLNGNGEHANGALNVGGTYIPAGEYTLTATSEDDPKQAKTITFRSRHC